VGFVYLHPCFLRKLQSSAALATATILLAPAFMYLAPPWGLESPPSRSCATSDSRFDSYHVEIYRMILGDIKDKLGSSTLPFNYQPVTSQNRVLLAQNGTVDIECGTTTNNTACAEDFLSKILAG